MVMGQEERKNKAKMEKTQIQLASTSNEYEAAVKALEETTGRWNRDWKAACDVGAARPQSTMLTTNFNQKFQDLEEERLDFTKSSLWTFANVASTVCVSDDAVRRASRFRGEMLTSSSPAKRLDSPWKVVKWKRISVASSRIEVPARRYQTHPNISTSAAVI